MTPILDHTYNGPAIRVSGGNRWELGSKQTIVGAFQVLYQDDHGALLDNGETDAHGRWWVRAHNLHALKREHPAEQGQERWSDESCICGGTGVVATLAEPLAAKPCPDCCAPASELEMCQRYFDPMRRSRDEAEKREKALREAIEEHRGAGRESLRRYARRDQRLYAALDQSGSREPWQRPCPTCGGDGCADCDGTGRDEPWLIP